MRPSAVSSSDTTEASLTSPEPVKPAPCQARASPMPLATCVRSVRSDEPGIVPEPVRPRRSRSVRSRSRSNSRGFRGTFEDLLAGHALAQHLAGRGRVAEPVDVPPPDLERRDAELLRDPVEVGLGRELDLRRPEAAERAVRWRVRARRPGADPDVRAAVRAAGVDGAAAQDDRRERAVRPAVHDHLDVLGQDPAVVGHPGPVPDDRRVALGRGRDVLVAVVDHADRSLRP